MSITIRIIGPAVAYDDASRRITSSGILLQLHGITHNEDVCSNYFEFGETLDNARISGGTIGLLYNGTKRQLEVVCTYNAPRRLNASERKELLTKTAGQLSDGIGECCFDPVQGHPTIHVDVWPANLKTSLRLIQSGTEASQQKRKVNLWGAATSGDVDGIVAALEAGVTVNKIAKGVTALHLAISYGHVEAVRTLLERGASVSRRDASDFTPLHTCIATKRVRKSFLTNERSMVSLVPCGLDPRDKDGKHGRLFSDGEAATATGAGAASDV